jgi:hypothetical protein
LFFKAAAAASTKGGGCPAAWIELIIACPPFVWRDDWLLLARRLSGGTIVD